MPINGYGVLKGRAVARQLAQATSPHYQIHIVASSVNYRIAVNVKSEDNPPNLLCLISQNFANPNAARMLALPQGYTALASVAGGLALDYQREKLFDHHQMKVVPGTVRQGGPDLNDDLDQFVQQALTNPSDVTLYAFGDRWGLEPGKPDQYFGFTPGNGIHDIHMNQGNSVQFAKDNGPWQDGALFFHFGGLNRWVVFFLAFQSQSWSVADQNPGPTPPPGKGGGGGKHHHH